MKTYREYIDTSRDWQKIDIKLCNPDHILPSDRDKEFIFTKNIFFVFRGIVPDGKTEICYLYCNLTSDTDNDDEMKSIGEATEKQMHDLISETLEKGLLELIKATLWKPEDRTIINEEEIKAKNDRLRKMAIEEKEISFLIPATNIEIRNPVTKGWDKL